MNSGKFESIRKKIEQGDRLNRQDAEALFKWPDILDVGELAHLVRTGLHDDRAYYVVNRHINYSNICVNGCAFCAFGKRPGDPEAFELAVEDIIGKLNEPGSHAITEVHIVGGCHPELPFDYYEEIIRAVKSWRPDVIVKAFTAVEIAHIASREGKSVAWVLERLKDAGLDMLPGGGAEIFAPSVRARICPAKISGDEWLEVMRTAHRLGIKSNATMLFGHLESFHDRIDHLLKLRDLQDETGGFVCFIPLPFLAKKSPLRDIPGPTGVDILRTIAVSRLVLDNIPHIKAYWVMLTVKLAQLALFFGADDFDGTVIEEKIGHMAGAESEEALTREEIEYLITSAGFRPVERNSFFEPLTK
ncbi:aminofutalosine synthase MqnE [Thermodesulforhabdus norvegica]|uniref:Aminodeoxyfutalosine synthase n=1 Tax=Thermodesulforhabdus norvegica TaxID=39841 RepID=A0A1I4UME1_9BACT|nr:aminofutalosine synthase MqnE [Thermodesulforhabdus norvegica]SFM90167.1 aminodeoxyfutalosine synthase [Thermodesulforhabdus norvegica]